MRTHRHDSVSPNQSLRPTYAGSDGAERQEWDAHEHLSEQVQLDAQKLVESAGNAELAKNAVDVAQARQTANPERVNLEVANTDCAHAPTRDELATCWGFVSYLEMFETSTVHEARDGGHWCMTAVPGGKWIVWSEADRSVIREFASSEAAQAEIERIMA